ncbi:MAG: cell division protein FtsL [Myxococcaceae bacterium]
MMTRTVASGGRDLSLLAVLIRLGPPAVIALAFAAAGIVHVCSRVLVVDMGYRLSTLERQSRELTREHDRLKLELATLKSPNRLERIARDQLGMGPAPAIAVLALGPAVPRLGRAPAARSNESRPGDARGSAHASGEGRGSSQGLNALGEPRGGTHGSGEGRGTGEESARVRPFRLADRGVVP